MIKRVDIGEIRGNPDNPRKTDDKGKLEKLVQSLKEFPEMLEARPIVVNPEMMVLGGNFRLKAARKAGLKEVPIFVAEEWSEDQEKEFIIKDNIGYGDWDWDILINDWDVDLLEEWGLELEKSEDDIREENNPDNDETENDFATELDRESNYIVLKFMTDIDWIQAKTLFGLGTETARRQNGKPWSSGIGRVLDGVEAIRKIQDEN